MKKIINSKFFKNLRKKYLQKIYDEISNDNKEFCCHVIIKLGMFICWKNLKEVKDNMNSLYLRYEIRTIKANQTCEKAWFENKEIRLLFLQECLDKFDE